MLVQAIQSTENAGRRCSFESWEPYLRSKGLNFDDQQDPVETLQLMTRDPAVSAAASCLTVNGIRQFYVKYPCGHYAAFTQNKEFEEIVVELLPGDEDILLSELLNRQGGTIVQERLPLSLFAHGHEST